jgi:hypothetical protein
MLLSFLLNSTYCFSDLLFDELTSIIEFSILMKPVSKIANSDSSGRSVTSFQFLKNSAVSAIWGGIVDG